MAGGWVEKHPRGKTKIINAVKPQILERTHAAVEAIRPTIHRTAGPGPHLQDSLHVEEKSWGARVHLGVPGEYEKTLSYEVGNTRQDGLRPLLHIRQRIERG